MAVSKSDVDKDKGFDTTDTMETPIAISLAMDFCLQDIMANENGHMTFECDLSILNKVKQLKAYWCKDGEVIKSSRRIKTVSDGNFWRLCLTTITPKDQGVYILLCNEVYNPVLSKYVLYIKTVKPKIPSGVFYVKAQPRHKIGMQSHFNSTKMYAGQTIELEASLKENKIEEFKWFKSNKIVKEDARIIILNDNKNTSLSIIKAKENDSGIYQVVGKTKYGVESTFAEVKVVPMGADKSPKDDYIPLVDETFTKIEEAYEEEEARLIFKIYFDNHTKFEWLKDGKVFEPNNEVQVQYYNSRYIALRLLNARMKDTGTYQLTVTNTVTGRSDTCECELLVKRLPIPKLIPVKIVEPLNSAVAYIGSEIAFKCKFEIEDSQFCCAVWEVGAYRVERSSNQFYVFCRGSEFYLRINEVVPDMAGLVFCKICKAIPREKSVSLCTSIANLTIIPIIMGEGIATKLKLRNKIPGFYNSGMKEVVLVDLIKSQTDNDETDTGESSGSSTTQTDLSSSNSQGEGARGNDEVKPNALEKSEDPTLDNIMPLDNFVVHVNRLSHTSGHYMIEPVEFKVESTSSMTTPSDENNEHSMIITYSKLDESVYWMEAISTHPEIFRKVTVENKIHEDANTPSGEVQRQKVILFQWKNPADYWFTVEILDANDFEGSGVTSTPQFKLRDAPVERILKFRICAQCPSNNSNYSVFIGLKVKEPPLSKSKQLNILAMENFKTIFNETGDNLGRGAFGQVDLVKSFSGDYYAAKKIKTILDTKKAKALREYKLLNRLSHPKLVQMHLAFAGKQNIILVMDYLWGGELFERLVQEDHINEFDVIVYVRQICEALQYIHSHNIIHMDIKPENILCDSPNTRLVKLADFGLARVLQEHDDIRAMYGTKEYVAPEVLNFEPLATSCDMWSFGVITYLLLSGVMPFTGSNPSEVSTAMTRGNFYYDDPAFNSISDHAKDFINKLILPRPATRMTASMALKHKWLNEGPTGSFGYPLKKTRDNLRDYLAKNRDRWQRAGNVVIAAHRLRNAALQKTQIEEHT
ncbi:striated muscle preferentially expressed protein kinase-like [Pieris rapae]|uniref:striated muscle preferentially expressed protein kinase-like n=1 Tax=Pieris rapae TaxID=64459 RepID=UPI001E2804F4|nr:striated muscle preferentially expressed protein kinase-like [Pieris rapae]XP_022129568.2 striated muscle preferentially expressed protein kinase-like [Pieris rapae]